MAYLRSETPEKALQEYIEVTTGSAGCAFKYTLVGGSIIHFFKGLCRSPDGARVAGAWHAMGVNAPRVAGKFGVWSGLNAAVDNALGYTRQKDDHWNHMAGTIIPTVLLSMHRGPATTARFAALAAVISVAMEVSLPIMNRFLAEMNDEKCLVDPCVKSSSSS